MGDNLFISKREFYPTVKDLKDMGYLSGKLISCWNIKQEIMAFVIDSSYVVQVLTLHIAFSF